MKFLKQQDQSLCRTGQDARCGSLAFVSSGSRVKHGHGAGGELWGARPCELAKDVGHGDLRSLPGCSCISQHLGGQVRVEVPLVEKEVVGVYRDEVERTEGMIGEVVEVRGHDRISPAHDSRSDDMAVPGVGEVEGLDQWLPAGHRGVGEGPIHRCEPVAKLSAVHAGIHVSEGALGLAEHFGGPRGR